MMQFALNIVGILMFVGAGVLFVVCCAQNWYLQSRTDGITDMWLVDLKPEVAISILKQMRN